MFTFVSQIHMLPFALLIDILKQTMTNVEHLSMGEATQNKQKCTTFDFSSLISKPYLHDLQLIFYNISNGV